MGNLFRKLSPSSLPILSLLRILPVHPILVAGSFFLACPHAAFSQAVPTTDSLSATFLRYSSQWLQEKLFVHVDKTFYLSGEFVWFKIYDVDARSNTPFTLSSIAYVEVLDKDQKAILQGKIALNNGSGEGSFRIPSSIPSGHYNLRAYTSWMKNFSADFYFRQQLTIFNTLSNEPPADSSGVPPSSAATPASSHEEYTVQFFPEGGNLVNGLSSVIAFKSVDPSGNGVSCSGVIIDQQKDTVAHFSSGRHGMGHFTFTPVHGNSYTALINAGSGNMTEKLPAAFDKGLVMRLDDIDAHHLRITVHSASTPVNPTLYLFVHTHHRIKSIQTDRLVDNQTVFSIDKDSLDDGISHLTLLTADRVPVCERLYCKPPEQRLHIDVNTITTAASAGSTLPATAAPSGTRRKLAIDLSSTDPSGHPVSADLSLSVFLIDSLQAIPDENILSYLLLRSDLKGKIENASSYFAGTDAETLQSIDNLMLTQGWTRFRWEDILGDKKPVFDFLPESNGPVIQAKLIDRSTGMPPAPSIAYLSVPGRRFKLSAALSRNDGSLFFHVDRFYGNRELILQTPSDSNYRIDVSNPFSDRFSPLSDADRIFSPQWKSQLLSRSIGVQAENAYRANEKYRIPPVSDPDTNGFYGAADRRYNLDEYTRFVTMNEVIREFVDNVKVRLQSGKTIFRVRNALFNLFFEDDPLLLIDGVPVFTGEKMLAINPLKIEKIDVVSHRYFLGPSITDGIVSFRSYDGDLGGYQLDPNAVVVQYNGLQEHRDFYSPVYETEAQIQSPLPDLRNQLLWRPDINTDSNGKKQLLLYTSDLTGTFALIVQGLSDNGLVGYSIKTFAVSQSLAPRQ